MAAGLVHGIIGCGRVAPNHVDGLRSLGQGELRWAVDRDPQVVKAFAAEHDIPHATTSVAEMLADPQVSSVSVTVDHAQHAALAEQALLAGKHVLVEKPMTLTRQDAQRLVDLAAERGLVLSVVSQHRFDPLVGAVRQWLSDGLLGNLLYAQISLEAGRTAEYYSESYWRGTRAGEGGSALINQGYHCLDVTRLLCGELTVRAAVTARAKLGDLIETEDTLSALLTAGPVPVTLNVTVGSAVTWRSRLEFVGTAGSVCFDLDHPGTMHRATGNPELDRRAATEVPAESVEPAPGFNYYGISHRRQIANFAGAVLGTEELATPSADAVAMVALLEDIYQAAGERQ
jgi:UDP-N-acetyl-2-amino-2-deoxyglucuronate dehydrogenase